MEVSEPMISWQRIDLTGREGIDLTVENLKMMYELEDANTNMLSRIIDYCKKNGVPFDNGLIVLLHEARKALEAPEVEKIVVRPSPETD